MFVNSYLNLSLGAFGLSVHVHLSVCELLDLGVLRKARLGT
jgi:hypothetical protein